MSDGMGRELAYLSSHATNRYFIPNWGNVLTSSVLAMKLTVLNWKVPNESNSANQVKMMIMKKNYWIEPMNK